MAQQVIWGLGQKSGCSVNSGCLRFSATTHFFSLMCKPGAHRTKRAHLFLLVARNHSSRAPPPPTPKLSTHHWSFQLHHAWLSHRSFSEQSSLPQRLLEIQFVWLHLDTVQKSRCSQSINVMGAHGKRCKVTKQNWVPSLFRNGTQLHESVYPIPASHTHILFLIQVRASCCGDLTLTCSVQWHKCPWEVIL